MSIKDTDKYEVETRFICKECDDEYESREEAIECFDSHLEETDKEDDEEVENNKT